MTTAAKKPTTAKKPTVKRTPRARRVVATATPMKPEVRELAAAVVAFASEKGASLRQDGRCLYEHSGTEGRRQGMVVALKMDNGSRVTVTVAVRQK